MPFIRHKTITSWRLTSVHFWHPPWALVKAPCLQVSFCDTAYSRTSAEWLDHSNVTDFIKAHEVMDMINLSYMQRPQG